MGGKATQRGGNFGDGLASAALTIIADARRALSNPDLSDAEKVHEVRKALKRWRALMRLLRRPLGDEADHMRAEARELMRALAGARDAQGALDALADVRKTDSAKLAAPSSAASLESLRRRLTTLRDTAEATSFTPAMRERLTHYLDFATLSLERWPLDAIDLEALSEGVTVTYRRARQLVPEHWASADTEHLHDLRRRVVEHRHQMELTDHLWPRLGKAWSAEMQRLRNQLGACQDLSVLSQFTMPHQPLAPWRSRLLPMIEMRHAAHIKTAARLAGRLFSEKPKAFSRRLAALGAARRTRKPRKTG